MKKIILLASIIAIALSSCGKKELEDKIITQQKLHDSIQAVLAAKDAEMESLFQELNSIESSLSEVSAKYGDVSKIKNTSGEVTKDTRTKITNQIQDINEILSANKQKLAGLNNQLKKSNGKNKELQAFIEKLELRINEQEEQIQTLTAELQQKKIVIENLNRNIEDLSKQNQNKDQQILQVEAEKNTAYYIVGSKKELQEQGIVNASGGFLGIGKKQSINNDSDLKKYTKVDIRKIDEIPLNGGKTKIMTSHPSSAYKLQGDQKKPNSLKISDRETFWGKSRFLVIMVD